jgi:hypothetical protein
MFKIKGKAVEEFKNSINDGRVSERHQHFLDSCKDLIEELEYTKSSGIPRCFICKKPFVKRDKFVWESDCECAGHNIKITMW